MDEELVIGIYHEYEHPYIEQIPSRSGKWENLEFVINELDTPCDVFIVLNQNHKEIEVECGSEIWSILQEPPVTIYPWMSEGFSKYNRVFGPINQKNKKKTSHYATHGALPWHVNKSYDELVNLPATKKKKEISWVTSNKSFFPGHLDRMKFLSRLQESDIEFDLYGKGFNYIEDKFDALYSYKYSLAIENYSGKNYWTEKLADCFLSYTMPIYYGCTNLEDYFPPESFISIDIKANNVIDKINEILLNDPYSESFDAIEKARNLVLNKYQLFPFISEKVNTFQITPSKRTKKILRPYRESYLSRIRRKLEKYSTEK